MRREDFMKPDEMRAEWRDGEIEKLQRRMQSIAENTLDKTGVNALINTIAEPPFWEEEEVGDLTLGLWSQDEKVTVDAQLEINQLEQTHEWEVMFFLPSVLEGDSVVTASFSYEYERLTQINPRNMEDIKSWLERECDRIYHHIEWNEEENRQNYRADRQKKRDIEAKKVRLAEETAWIDEQVRLLDPLVGAF